MKRIGNLYQRIVSIENLNLADNIARKGKSSQPGIIQHDKERETNIIRLHNALIDHTFRTSPYSIFKVYEPKEREVYRLPYYPDRIVHHAIMNVLEPIFVASFTADTYSCIKGKGIHAAANAVKRALGNEAGTSFCLKLDITKFYPAVDHAILKALLRRKFKDNDLLGLLDEIIDSANGLPIGNYLSQYFANFYLSYFDHWLKEVKKVKYYFRYADDLVILHDSKPYLHGLLIEIKDYLHSSLNLQVKPNHQVFPVNDRGIDFVGYKFFHRYTHLRKSIKQNFARMLASRPNLRSLASYWGWASHCNSAHLLKKLLNCETVQRIRDQETKQRIRRRQNKTRAPIKQGNNCP